MRWTTRRPAKAELEDTLEQVADLVDDALDPELTREELVSKVKEISGLVTGEEEENEHQDDDQQTDEDERVFPCARASRARDYTVLY